MESHDLLAGVVVFIGLFGTVLVVIPGIPLQLIAVALWAFEESTVVGWITLGVVVVVAVTATVLKYVFPGRQLREAGVPRGVLAIAVATAIAGLFLIPVIGAPIGFVVAIYVFERIRTGRERAWPSTKSALKAVLTSTGIELAGGFLILVVFVAGAFLT